MRYESPELEVIVLKNEDIVTMSTGQTKPEEDDYEFSGS